VLNIDPEAFAIDWPVEQPWRIDAVAAQGGEECHGLPVSVGNLSRQALTAQSPPAQRPHIRLGPGFIDEDQPPRINAALEGLPPPALAGAGMVLLAGSSRADATPGEPGTGRGQPRAGTRLTQSALAERAGYAMEELVAEIGAAGCF
jgi:hypothetical protein